MSGPSFERILIVVAMEAEARPVRANLGLSGISQIVLHPAFPATLAVGPSSGLAVATNGADPRFDVDSIATQPATTTTLHAVEAFKPNLVISAGTAGGFEERGGSIGEVVVADRVVFHDRRVAIPGFDRYGIGDYPVADLRTTAATLGLRVGTVSTGNSLDAPSADLIEMAETNAIAKDMEAASVAWVCERVGVPFVAVKSITDLVDHTESASAQFNRNLQLATASLAEAIRDLVEVLQSDSATSSVVRHR